MLVMSGSGLVMGGFGWLWGGYWVVMGGFGWLSVVIGGYQCLRVFFVDDGWLRGGYG